MKTIALALVFLSVSHAYMYMAPRRTSIQRTAVQPSRSTALLHRRTALLSSPSTIAAPTNRLAALKDKLASTGRAGLLAYGILNFVYYSTVTFFAWRLLLLRSPVVAPGLAFGQRVQATAAKLGSVAGIVWAGSQVTKVFRLSGAIVMAPVVDKLMSWTQTKFNLKSRNAAFWAIIGALWGTLFVFYGSLILYGAALG